MSKTDNFNPEDLYDRQTRTYGIDSINYLKNGNVYIMNPNYELSLEIIKNLVLTGIQNIYIKNLDDNYFGIDESFYLNKCDGNFLVQIKAYVNDLNPSININHFDTFSEIKDESTLIIINQNYNSIFENYNYKILRNTNKCKMIFGWDNNYSGCLFVDAGNNHIVNIPNDITFETKKVDKIIDSTVYVENHGYQDGDIISFNNLQGNCII